MFGTASAELQLKLAHRLRLQRELLPESSEASRQTPRSSALSPPRAKTGDGVNLRTQSLLTFSALDPEPTSEAASTCNVSRLEARRVELQGAVSRLHSEIDSLQQDLAAVRRESNALRAAGTGGSGSLRTCYAVDVPNSDKDVYRFGLVGEPPPCSDSSSSGSTCGKRAQSDFDCDDAILKRFYVLEKQVAGQVIAGALLKARVRQSAAGAGDTAKLVEAAERGLQSARDSRAEVLRGMNAFFLNLHDDRKESGANAGGERDRIGDDLECVYDSLELFDCMGPEALSRLAQLSQRGRDRDAQIDLDAVDVNGPCFELSPPRPREDGVSFNLADNDRAADEDVGDTYQTQVVDLQRVLTELQGPSSHLTVEQDQGDGVGPVPDPVQVAPPSLGEAPYREQGFTISDAHPSSYQSRADDEDMFKSMRVGMGHGFFPSSSFTSIASKYGIQSTS